MLFYAINVLVSAVLIVLISELAKRHSLFAALIASLPLTTLMAMLWMRLDGSSVSDIAGLCSAVFWLVLPSLVFFLIFPLMIKQGLAFWLSLGISVTATAVAYFLMLPLLRRWDIQF